MKNNQGWIVAFTLLGMVSSAAAAKPVTPAFMMCFGYFTVSDSRGVIVDQIEFGYEYALKDHFKDGRYEIQDTVTVSGGRQFVISADLDPKDSETGRMQASAEVVDPSRVDGRGFPMLKETLEMSSTWSLTQLFGATAFYSGSQNGSDLPARLACGTYEDTPLYQNAYKRGKNVVRRP